ncbi:ribosomal protein S12 methylthiotransferase accessory factor [Paenibacillus sp. UNCCL117]|uniref:TOMM precursor leader peptide-binding protein n=1 Tax=unclassified Paenibacillus TaxID=185978 RepID=UPI00088D7A78|nr:MULTISPECIES: TOMM precursor leader peptide-binding protein [unclassified Paenibacillus]SDC12114.1 ribosomal protein S12 methylthiotransferase accessory factor [Paenibacillus sp. cl123]SFW16745.1 ribosomal protein S12 methylthiotransferase accessory factor [Paenibacillus sp. UNCCL117]
MSAIVAVIGSGQLSNLVCNELLSECEIVRQPDFQAGIPEAVKLALVLHDAWHPAVHREAETVLRQAGAPWLRGFVAWGEGVVGPLVRPDAQGCSQCADTRRLMAGRDRKEMWELQQQLALQGENKRDVWASRTGLLQVAHLLAVEARKVIHGNSGSLEGRILLINMNTLNSSRHFFLSDPMCPVCSRLPDDSKEAARIALQPNPKISADSYRCRSIEELKSFLAKDYLDSRTGFLNGKMRDLISPFADASVNLPLFGQDEATAGRSHSYADSELTAILESLERYCGMSPRGKRTVIRDSYRNLEADAMNPLQVGVHAKEHYELEGFPFQPFDPDRPMDWVWGYSFLRERPILVPELLSYYSMSCGRGLVFETSNGCALGGSLEEAIFYGMLEAVERDSFLMTWYAELPLPRLDPYSVNDPELHLMIGRLQAVAGFDVHLYNSTMEHGIPSVWAIAKNNKKRGINLLCAAGAHPDPVRAVKSAIHELAGMLLSFEEKFETNRAEYERMLQDPYQVRHMEDHSMLYGLPQAEERLRFLLDENRPLKTFAEEFGPKARHADLTDDLTDLIQALRKVNLDVIVVDQTTPEIARNGLYCVKVLIPGLLPMTFGYHFTRLTGLERVLRVPAELGYRETTLTPQQLNPHPHPFP